MKTRNLLIALTCIVLFILAGIFYFNSWVVQKPFAVILITGDAVNTSSLAAARIYDGGTDKRLALESLPHVGLLRLISNEFSVPDAAAASSALATGQRVNQNALSADSNGKPLITLLELATKAGRRTGLVTNASIVDPALAAHYAYATDGSDYSAIAAQIPDLNTVDLLLGGGEKFFLPIDKGGVRTDSQDLILSLRQKKWTVVRTKAELASVPTWLASRTIGVFSRDDLAGRRQLESGGEEPSLEEMVRSAISILQSNPKGYFLVVDAGLIERNARANNGEGYLSEVLALDNAVSVARRYAGDSALIVVAGRQSPGGLRMNGYPFRQDQGAAVLGVNVRGVPSLTWSTGPNGPINRSLTSEAFSDPGLEGEAPLAPSARAAIEPATYFTPEALNTVDDPLIFSDGPGTDVLTGYLEPATVFLAIKNQL